MSSSRHSGLPVPVVMLGCALAGAAITALAMSFARGTDEPTLVAPGAGLEDRTPASSAAVVPASENADLAMLTSKVDALHATLQAVEAKVDAALAARVPADAASGSALAIDPEVLQQALMKALAGAAAKAKRDKLDAMKVAEVIAAARELTNSRKDLPEARDMLEALLQRQLTAEERQDALLNLGITHRSSADYANSQHVLQQAIDAAGGVGTASGAWAMFQLAWTHQFAGDAAAARRCFEQAAGSAGGNDAVRIESRWNAAKLGDPADANVRAEFEAILREIGSGADFEHIAADVKRRLQLR